MQFLFRSLPKPHSHSNYHHHHHHRRTFVDSTIKHVRDRGLDHAVEREKNLKPLHHIKNIIKSEPSKSLPITIITQHKDSLHIPFRPIELIRKYPSIFEEFRPGGAAVHPHIKLTPELLNLDAEENLVYQSQTYKQNVADRLLKLLMLSRINKIPLKVLEILKWDLGLPNDYAKSVVPEFPDYFRVIGGGLDSVLELVCWSDELAVSVVEKKAMKAEMGYKKGMPIAFPMQFSTGFEMDKDVKKWMDEWQKLPYVSPYENSVHLSPTSDESDKWAAGVLHELLHLFVGKKADKENVLCLGEYLGVRSRFKRVLLHHPGIFYVSSKIGTYTVVLKEGYKRGLLIESNPLMNVRNQYLHLMHMVKEDKKSISVPGGSKQEEKGKTPSDDDCKDDDNAEEDDVSDDDDDEEEEEDDENESHGDARKNVSVNRGRTNRKTNLDVKWGSRNTERERYGGKHSRKAEDKGPPNLDVKWGSRNTERERSDGKHSRKAEDKGPPNLDVKWGSRNTERGRYGGKHSRKAEDKGPPNIDVKWGSRNTERERYGGKHSRKAEDKGPPNIDVKWGSRNTERERFGGKHSRKAEDKGPPKISRRTEMHGGHNSRGSSRTEMHGGHNGRGNSQGRSSSHRGRGRSLPDKRTST